jgi:hypothetical protein
VSGSGNLIGGTANGARNVISGNPDDGLDIFPGSTADSVNNLVQGNLIGVAADGVSPLGNGLIGIGGRGVSILGASSNIIGGLISGSANVIANNGYDGVWLARTFGTIGAPGSNNLVLGNIIASNGAFSLVMGGTAAGVTLLGPNVISSNSIYGNIGLGIDAGGDGPTLNTPNGNSNYPILTSAHRGSTDIDGTLNAAPNCVYHIEFYSNDPTDPNPQAKSLLGSINVPTDGSGNVTFHAPFTQTVPIGSKITATATAKCPGNPADASEISQFTIVVGLSDLPPSPLTYANHVTSGTDNDPISLLNGELFDLSSPDLALGGPLPLVFQRYYAAFLEQDGLITGKLGNNWLHNF